MKAEEKIVLARILDLSSDYLAGGYKRNRNEYNFTDDPAEKPRLPLAYTTEESVESDSDLIDTEKPIAAEIAECKACGLAASRTNTVPGEGSQSPLVMVIGAGPGAEEEAKGRPFVGNAGQLLDRMLASIGLYRGKNCFIANMVKCRPPGNRDPEPSETAACYPFLERQILLLRPLVILCAGRVAAQNLLKTSEGINALRGKFTEIKIAETSIPVLPIFHPGEIIKDNKLRNPAWEDLKTLRSRLASMNSEYAASTVSFSDKTDA